MERISSLTHLVPIHVRVFLPEWTNQYMNLWGPQVTIGPLNYFIQYGLTTPTTFPGPRISICSYIFSRET